MARYYYCKECDSSVEASELREECRCPHCDAVIVRPRKDNAYKLPRFGKRTGYNRAIKPSPEEW